MRQPLCYRYLLASRPGAALRGRLVALQDATGQSARPVRPDLLHLTWCVLAEEARRAPFVLPRVAAALAGPPLASGLLRLGRVRGGRNGAAVHGRGPRPEFMRLYRDLVARLAAHGLEPLHRAAGLHPHVTLGHAPCGFDPFPILDEWMPDALLLIESEVGNMIHNLLARWPLLPPRQGVLPFAPPAGADCAGDERGARRRGFAAHPLRVD